MSAEENNAHNNNLPQSFGSEMAIRIVSEVVPCYATAFELAESEVRTYWEIYTEADCKLNALSSEQDEECNYRRKAVTPSCDLYLLEQQANPYIVEDLLRSAGNLKTMLTLNYGRTLYADFDRDYATEVYKTSTGFSESGRLARDYAAKLQVPLREAEDYGVQPEDAFASIALVLARRDVSVRSTKMQILREDMVFGGHSAEINIAGLEEALGNTETEEHAQALLEFARFINIMKHAEISADGANVLVPTEFFVFASEGIDATQINEVKRFGRIAFVDRSRQLVGDNLAKFFQQSYASWPGFELEYDLNGSPANMLAEVTHFLLPKNDPQRAPYDPEDIENGAYWRADKNNGRDWVHGNVLKTQAVSAHHYSLSSKNLVSTTLSRTSLHLVPEGISLKIDPLDCADNGLVIHLPSTIIDPGSSTPTVLEHLILGEGKPTHAKLRVFADNPAKY